MVTIKSHTDLEQSKKLAEILPIESADMYWWYNGQKYYVETIEHNDFQRGDIPAWSLAALLNILPIHERTGYEKVKPYIHFNVFTNKWICNSLYYISDSYNNPVDAVFEMILKLHESNLL